MGAETDREAVLQIAQQISGWSEDDVNKMAKYIREMACPAPEGDLIRLSTEQEQAVNRAHLASARTVTPAPDGAVFKEQADAWQAVCSALNAIDPDWILRAKSGMDSAVLTIKELAAKTQAVAEALKPDEALVKRVLETAAFCSKLNMRSIADLLGECAAALTAQGGEQMLVPVAFLRGFNTLTHNYSLGAEPPFYYSGRAGDAFKDAYARCAKDLAQLKAILSAQCGEQTAGYKLTGPSYARRLVPNEGGEQTDTVSVSIVDLADPLRFLVELKHIKRRMEAGTATDSEAKFYEANKETAWLNAERALAAAKEGK